MRVSEREIVPESIFSKDKLSREKEVELLSKIIRNAVGPYVISIDAPWGTGKTYFTKILQTNLNTDIQTIYINAWESDYNTDPSVSIISELKAVVSQDRIEKITNKLFKFSKIVVPSAIKVASYGLIDAEKIAEAVSDIGESLIMKKIEAYQEEKKAIGELRDSLKESANEAKGGKIVVFVDELDRCRPSYAIDFLERVKHFFEVEGFIFVLSIDESQLIESIKVNYGQKFQSEKYLRRFIDFKFFLKPIISNSFIKDSFNRLGLDKFIRSQEGLEEGSLEKVIKITEYLSNLSNLSARDVNQIISKLNIRLLSKDEGKRVSLIELQLVLIFLRHINKELYKKYIEKKEIPDRVIEELSLNLDKFDQYGSPKYLNTFLTALIFLQISDLDFESPFLNKMIELRSDMENLDQNMKNYATSFLRIFERYDAHTFDYVVKQFEQEN